MRKTNWRQDAIGYTCVAAFWLLFAAVVYAWMAGIDSWPMWAGAR